MALIPVVIHVDRIATTAVGEFKGAKVRAGFVWSPVHETPTGKKQPSAKKTQWTPFVELKKEQSKGVPASVAATFSNCVLTHSTPSDVREALSLVVEKEGFFSNTIVCTILLDTHELFYAGALVGPLTGKTDMGAVWNVMCRLAVAEPDGNRNALAPQPVAPNTVTPSSGLTVMPPSSTQPEATTAEPTKLILPDALRSLPLSIEAMAHPQKKEHTLPIRRKTAGAAPTPGDGGGEGHSSGLPVAALHDATPMPTSVAKAIAALGFPPYVAAKVYVRPLPMAQQQHAQPIGATVPSRLAAIMLAPLRDASLTEDDLEMLMDTFSVPLGHSVVVTVGANAAVRSSLWRPELAAELNTAGQGFATNTKADAGTQTGDVAQLRSRTVTPHPTSAAAIAARNSAEERLRNTEAFQMSNQLIAEANRRESLAVAEAAKLRHALARVSQELEVLRQERAHDDDEGTSHYATTTASGGRRNHLTQQSSGSVWASLSSHAIDRAPSERGIRAVSPASLDGYLKWTSPGPLTSLSPWSTPKQQQATTPPHRHNGATAASDWGHQVGIRSPRSYASFSDDDASL